MVKSGCTKLFELQTLTFFISRGCASETMSDLLRFFNISMDKDNSVGISCGNGAWAGGGQRGENWDNSNSINNTIFNFF